MIAQLSVEFIRETVLLALPTHAAADAQIVSDTLILTTVFIILQELPSILRFTIARQKPPVSARKMVTIIFLTAHRLVGRHRAYISLEVMLRR
jgi:hypothetical protein